jgi:hypothetical protein
MAWWEATALDLMFLCPGSIQTGWNLAHLSSHNFENVEWTNLWCQKRI